MRVLSNFYYVTNIFDLHIFENKTAALLIFFFNLHGYAFWFFIFSKWKKHDNLPFDDTFKMYCCAFWFIKTSKCQQYFFEKGAAKKHKFFIFLKGGLFVMGGPIDINVGIFWETPVDFLKSVVLQLFLKYNQSDINLNVKSRAKFNCL